MHKVIFLEKAHSELREAAQWYAERQEGLDSRFKKNVFNAIDRLQSDILVHATVYRGLSRVFVKRFPYIIYFKKDTKRKEIVIHGILHNHQDRSALDL